MPANWIVNGLGTDFLKPVADLFIDHIKAHYSLSDPPLAPDPAIGDAYTSQQKADNLIITHAKWTETHSYHLGVIEKKAPIRRDGQRLNQWEFNQPMEFIVTVQALQASESDWGRFHDLTQEILGILGQMRSVPTPDIAGIRSIMLTDYGEPIIVGNVFQRTIYVMLQYRKQDDTP